MERTRCVLFLNKSDAPVVSAKLQGTGPVLTHPVSVHCQRPRRFGFLAQWLQSCHQSLFPVTVLQYNSPLFDLNTCELLKGDCRPGTPSWPSPLSPRAAREAILVANTEMCPSAGKHRNPKHQISWLGKTRIMWSYNKLKPQKLTGNSTSTIMSLRFIFFQILMKN